MGIKKFLYSLESFIQVLCRKILVALKCLKTPHTLALVIKNATHWQNEQKSRAHSKNTSFELSTTIK